MGLMAHSHIHSHIKRRLLISAGVVLLIILLAAGSVLIIANRGYVDYVGSASVRADFSKVTGTINLDYGLNEEANWMDFAGRQDIQSLHSSAGSGFIRVWLDDPPHRVGSSTIPYEDWKFNFTNLDSFVNGALKSGATPYMVFAYAPDEIWGEGGIGNANVPRNDWEFGHYCAEVVSHYKWMCENGRMAEECDIDDWYWEIWNEPYWDYWWDDSAYINLYNEAYSQIKAVAPGTKVGGYSYRFLTAEDEARVRQFLQDASGVDFISIHAYGNYPISEPNDDFCIANIDSSLARGVYQQEMIGNNELLFYEKLSKLQKDIDTYFGRGAPEIIVSELGPNWNWKYEPYLDEPFVAAWYASALNWMIRTNVVDKEFYYSGTSNLQDGGFALWSVNSGGGLTLFPAYLMKRDFVMYNQKDSIVFEAESDSRTLEVLAVSNPKGAYLTLINKLDSPRRDVRIDIKNRAYSALFDIKYGKRITDMSIDLEPYEVRFIQIV